MSSKDCEDTAHWWYDFVYYYDTKFKKDGHYVCSLLETIKGNETLFPKSVVNLATRKMPYKRVDAAVLNEEIPQPPPYRFKVNFLTTSFIDHPKDPGRGTTTTMLKEFYMANLEPFFQAEMNYGDNDAIISPVSFVDGVLLHPSTFHILLSVCANEELENGSLASKVVPIAALSFCSDETDKSHLVVSLVAVSSQRYTNNFGRGNDNKPWRGRGLFKYLLMVGHKLHCSFFNYGNSVTGLATLLDSSGHHSAFLHSGFRKIGTNIKDVFGFPFVKEPTTMRWNTRSYYGPKYVPYLAEGNVYGIKWPRFGNPAESWDPFTPMNVEEDKEGNIIDACLNQSDTSVIMSCPCGTADHVFLEWYRTCVFCSNSIHPECSFKLSSAEEWDVVETITDCLANDIKDDFLGNTRQWAICPDCAKTTSFSLTPCSFLSTQKNIQCFVFCDKNHRRQTCEVCNEVCHFPCSVARKARELSNSKLFDGCIELVCLKCIRGQKSTLTYGTLGCDDPVKKSLSPVVLEFPFPISLGELTKQVQFSFTDDDENAISNYCELAKELLSFGLGLQQEVDQAGLKKLLVDTASWEPEAWVSNCNRLPVDLLLKTGNIGNNELQEWMKDQPFVSQSFFCSHFGSKLCEKDMFFFDEPQTLPVSLNLVDSFIMLLNQHPVPASSCVWCLPMTFAGTALTVHDAFGRRGLGRYVSTIFSNKNGDVLRDLFSTKKMLMFPFQCLFSEAIYLAVVEINFGERVLIFNRPTGTAKFHLIRYGNELCNSSLDAMYVSVLRDLVDLAFLHCGVCRTKLVSASLHAVEGNFSQYGPGFLPDRVVIDRSDHGSKEAMINQKQTQFLLDDILFLYSEGQNLIEIVFDEIFDHWRRTPVGTIEEVFEPLAEFISNLIIFYMRSMFERSVVICEQAVKGLEQPGSNNSWIQIHKDVWPMVPQMKANIRYLYKNDLFGYFSDKAVLASVLRSIMYFTMLHAHLFYMDRTHNWITCKIPTVDCIGCAKCKRSQIPDLMENRTYIFPEPNSVIRFGEHYSRKPDWYLQKAFGCMDDAIGRVIEDKREWEDIFEYIQDQGQDWYDQVLDGVDSFAEILCSLSPLFVTGLVELLAHEAHCHETTAIIYATDEEVARFVEGNECFRVPPNIQNIFCVAFLTPLRQHAVLLIDRKSRQVLVYDGRDTTIEHFLGLKGQPLQNQLSVRSTTIEDWREYGSNLMRVMSLIPATAKTLTVQKVPMQTRSLHQTYSNKTTWQMLPAQFIPTMEYSRVYRQKENYDSGIVAVTQMSRLLGLTIPVEREEQFETFCSLTCHLWGTYIENWVVLFFPESKVAEIYQNNSTTAQSRAKSQSSANGRSRTGDSTTDDPNNTNDTAPTDVSEESENEETKTKNNSRQKDDSNVARASAAPPDESRQEATDSSNKTNEKKDSSNETNEKKDASDASQPGGNARDETGDRPCDDKRDEPSDKEDEKDDESQPRANNPLDDDDSLVEDEDADFFIDPDADPTTFSLDELYRSVVIKTAIKNVDEKPVNSDEAIDESKENGEIEDLEETIDAALESGEIEDFDELFLTIGKDDVNPTILVHGLPDCFEHVEVSDMFPVVTRYRYNQAKNFWEITFPVGSKRYMNKSVSEDFISFLFGQLSVNDAKENCNRWNPVIFSDYRQGNVKDLERHLSRTGIFTTERAEFIQKIANDYFYFGSVCRIDCVKHVIMLRPSTVKNAITSTFKILRDCDSLTPETMIDYAVHEKPLWFAKITNVGTTGVTVRRILQSWAYRNIPLVLMTYAVNKTSTWKYMTREGDKVVFGHEDNVLTENNGGVDAPVVQWNMQISHVVFKPYNKQLMDYYMREFKLPDGYKYGISRGWFFGTTEGDKTKCELLDYEWITTNLTDDMIEEVTRKRKRMVWYELPASAGRSDDEPVVRLQKGRRHKRYKADSKTVAEFETTDLDAMMEETDEMKRARLEASIIQWRMENPRLDSSMILEIWPPMKYQQKPTDKTCLFLSMASALYFMSYHVKNPLLRQIASSINDNATFAATTSKKSEERIKQLKNIIAGTFVSRKGKSMIASYPEFVEKIAYYTTVPGNQFDPLSEHYRENYPTVAVCESVDKSRDHAITFFGNWLFDSNERKAFPITRESLNRCVPHGFLRVLKAWRFGTHIYTSSGHKRKR